jgi:hypothetical protein
MVFRINYFVCYNGTFSNFCEVIGKKHFLLVRIYFKVFFTALAFLTRIQAIQPHNAEHCNENH